MLTVPSTEVESLASNIRDRMIYFSAVFWIILSVTGKESTKKSYTTIASLTLII